MKNEKFIGKKLNYKNHRIGNDRTLKKLSKKKKKMSTPFIPLFYESEKDLATNILMLCSFLLILIITLACFYPLCCRRPIINWIEKKKTKHKEKNDDLSENSIELTQTLI